MVTVTERVQLVIETVQKGMKGALNNVRGFNYVMKENMQQFKKTAPHINEFSNRGARFATRVRMMTHGMRGFRMEMLGVMFFGMGMARFFSGLLQPAMDLVGIFNLFSTTLGILFLPVAMLLLQILLPIMLWFIDLPEPVKLVIGIIVLLAAVFFKLLFIIGMLALGIGSIILAFGGWTAVGPIVMGVFGAISGFLATFGVLLLAIFAVIVVAIIGFVLAWKENFGNIKQWVEVLWEGLKQFFDGIWKVIKGIVDIFIGLFSGDTEKIKEGGKKLWEGLKDIFIGGGKFLIGLVVTLGLSLFRAFLGLLKSIVTLLGEGFGLLWEKLLLPAYEFGKNLVLNIIEGIKKFGGLILDTIMGFLPKGLRESISGLFGETTSPNTAGEPISTNENNTTEIVSAINNLGNNLSVTVNAPKDYDVVLRSNSTG